MSITVGGSPGPTEPIHHRRAAVITALAAVVTSWLVAVRERPPGWELRVFRALNELPEVTATVLHPVMQFGTIASPLVVAMAVLIFRRDRVLALAAVLVGFAAWFGARAIKRVVGRQRPIAFVQDLIVRDGDGKGLGYVSGHSAVAAATAVIVVAALPVRYRWLPVLAAFVVGVARIIHGVHLPADVVGGWGFGTLLGLGGVALAERFRRPTNPNRAGR